MNRSPLLAFAAGVVAAASVACLVGAESSPTNAPVGRYQIVPGSNPNSQGCWVIDTATGHTWFRYLDSSWNDQGTPNAPR